jgi:type IV secretory pathway component VirB8
VLSLETATQDLHEQMLASSELIKALAEQNTQLIRRAEVNRVRLLLLAGITAVLAVATVIGLTLVLGRP